MENVKRYRTLHFSYPVIFLILLVMAAIANQVLCQDQKRSSDFLLKALLGVHLNLIFSLPSFSSQSREPQLLGKLLSAALSVLPCPAAAPRGVRSFCRTNGSWQKQFGAQTVHNLFALDLCKIHLNVPFLFLVESEEFPFLFPNKINPGCRLCLHSRGQGLCSPSIKLRLTVSFHHHESL